MLNLTRTLSQPLVLIGDEPSTEVLLLATRATSVSLAIREPGQPERLETLRLDETTGAGPCTVQLRAVQRKQAWLGFDAPRHVPIHRPEAKKKTPRTAA